MDVKLLLAQLAAASWSVQAHSKGIYESAEASEPLSWVVIQCQKQWPLEPAPMRLNCIAC